MSSTGPRFTLYKWTTGLGAGLVQSLAYFAVGTAHFDRSTELLRTRLDDAIPFLPASSWLYLPFYAAIFLVAIAGFRTREHFNRGLIGVGSILLVGLVCHRLIPAEYPRPLLHPPYRNVSYAFMAWVQAVDPPGNVFPSLHVAHTCSLALILHHENRRLGRILMVMAALLALSTLTTKQHFIADVVSGMLLAAVTRLMVLRGIAPVPPLDGPVTTSGAAAPEPLPADVEPSR